MIHSPAQGGDALRQRFAWEDGVPDDHLQNCEALQTDFVYGNATAQIASVPGEKRDLQTKDVG